MKITTIPAILNMAIAAPLVIQGAFTRLVLTEFEGQPITSEADAQRVCETTASPDVAAAYCMFKPYRQAIAAAAATKQTRQRVASKAAADRWSSTKRTQESGNQNASSIVEHPSSIAEHTSSIAKHSDNVETQPVVAATATDTSFDASSIVEHQVAATPSVPPLSPHTPLTPSLSPPKKPAPQVKKSDGVNRDGLDSLTDPDRFALTPPEPSGQLVPVQAIVDLYHSILPTAAHVDLLTDNRIKAIKARWGEDKKRQSLQWWQGLFEYIRDTSKFLMGLATPDSGRRPFKLTIDFVMNQQRLSEICEGKFSRD